MSQFFVPGIVLIEMTYLVERGRLDAAQVNRAFSLLDIVGAVMPLRRLIRRQPGR